MWVSIRKYGSVLLRFHYPTGTDLHVHLWELGQPTTLELLTKMQRVHGVPELLPPNLPAPPVRMAVILPFRPALKPHNNGNGNEAA